MSDSEKNNNQGMDETTKVVLAALIGAGVGAAATLLFTTDKGSEVLQVLKSPLNAISDGLGELAEASKEKMSDVKESVEEATAEIKEKAQ